MTELTQDEILTLQLRYREDETVLDLLKYILDLQWQIERFNNEDDED